MSDEHPILWFEEGGEVLLCDTHIMNQQLKRMEHVVEEQYNLVETLGESFSRKGFTRLAGQILTVLYLADEHYPLTASDLAHLLRVSRSTVSVALSELLSVTLIKTTRVLGSRREHYTPSGDVFDLYTILLRLTLHKDIEGVLQACHNSLSKIPKGEHGAVIHQRIEEVCELYKRIEHCLTVLTTLPKPQAKNLMTIPFKEFYKLTQ